MAHTDFVLGLVWQQSMQSSNCYLQAMRSFRPTTCMGSYRIFTKIFQDLGIVFHFVDMQDPANVAAKINDKTKLIWVETPTNPMMNVVDITAMSQLVADRDIYLAVDNTFASPYLQQPLSMGADIVMHSATKYLGGHSDVILGALVVR